MITMTLDWGALVALIGWSLFVFWLGRKSAGPRDRDLSGPPPSFTMQRPLPSARPGPATLSPEALAAIRGELARGNKINAIKLMREATGLGLAESKQAVEAMEI
ncbi:ribosomal protein L7/L12 [Novosphingobium sp. G106]|uniref:ribosomal protein L7/L12 n=1 Tax=Novosphingobium sp. G106 TaxID=2849500 RepID=UPI001C2CF770|nr:ribosomal protein L7/L12 [Novosphingobium sp. G106]MBV1690073.1 ribosomal protein L7/L12 [Novosphingobium sp. G106]